MGLLDRAGARLTARPEDAEILVVNTCSFIDTAKQESVDTILEMARHKSAGRAKKLIVAGCLVERYRDEIQKNIPEVDAVVGTGELEVDSRSGGPGARSHAAAPLSPFTILTTTHAETRPGKESQSGTHKALMQRTHPAPKATPASAPAASFATPGPALRPLLPTYLYDETTPRLLSTPRASAYIKIAEGCDHPCTFCVIPNLRGKFRSRRFESVVAEAEQLVARGVREITLIGQDTTCYGEDLGLRDGLATLLDTLARIPNLRWLRFLYAYPNRITGKLLETIARHDNICKYLDLPLQHASPDVLKRMKRGAGADIFLKTLSKVRAAVPGIALRTSFIVGFPGESLRRLRTSWRISSAKRNSTGSASSATRMKKAQPHILSTRKFHIAPSSRAARRLMKLQQSISRRAKKNWIGRELTVLAEGPSAETPLLWEGRTEFHAPEIDGKVFINDFGPLDDLEPGRFYRAQITESHDYDLVARILTTAK